ncbi:glutaredoxin family protein [Hydrogenophaga sp.]|uniref:glutaredoxin family protein n=1 Tax=Hydrogenophaga sp. TaxID=1904254 RepID=UPI00271ACB0E|nr:glutaredoxin family protein [Hydrogenophaga sp.]MDO9438276.1 glutaredoxin family protein [Hydrogenophaga sp.]
MNIPNLSPRLLTLALLAGMLAAPALAQGVYRIVGPDGKVTFSDQPPPASTPVQPKGNSAPGVSSSSAGGQLPYELRQVSNRFPVTLYTSKECAPCNSGRNLLNARGIPYSEKTVETPQDAEALKRVSSDTSLPFLTIGSQQIKGYSDSEWTQFLDAAGYPKQSALPSAYRRPAAAPLVAVRPETPSSTPTPSSAGAPRAPAEIPVTPSAQNPAGIRF